MKKNIFHKLLMLLVGVMFCSNMYAQTNMSFIENKGQWLENIAYKTELNFGNIYFEKDNFTFILMENKEHQHHAEHIHKESKEAINGHHFKIKFLDACKEVSFEEENKSLHYYNYFLGKDTSKWASNVHAYKAINYHNLYSGIDMKVFGYEDNMKYEYYVAPFQDPNQIKVQYIGLDKLDLKNGNLIYETKIAGITETKPIVFQIINDKKVFVKCNYKLNKKTKTVRFEFPNGYDETKELIIDPTLIFSSYTGSTLNNFGFTATYDNDGNLFGGGIVYGQASGLYGYPSINSFNLVDTTSGSNQTSAANGYFSDISISKFNANGTNLLYSTLIGGSENEQPQSLVCDSVGNLYIYGRTNSTNFPTTIASYDTAHNGGFDIVVSKISSAGNVLMASTYVGGTNNDGVNMSPSVFAYGQLKYNYADDGRGEIILDENDNIYVASSTQSNNIFNDSTVFQSSFGGGFQDACIFKLNNDLSALKWGSYLGGSINEAGYGVKVDQLGHVFVTGGTNSLDFPGTVNALLQNYQGGRADGFIAKIDTNGTNLIRSTYLGTADYDQSFFIEIDEFNDVFVFGQSTGAYPVFGNVYTNPNSSQFIHKLNNSLDTTIFSTVFGSGSAAINISPTAFLVDYCGNIYISGWGGTTNLTGNTNGMPITPNAFQTTTDGSDFYIIVLDNDAENLLYGTYFGGNQFVTGGSGEHVDGGTSRFDKNGIIYQAVCAACNTSSNNFPTTPGAWSQTNGAGYGCNVGLIKMEVYVAPTIVQVDASPTATGCVPLTVNFESELVNVNLITWDFGDGTTSNLEDPVHLYSDTGTFIIRLIGEDTSLCNLADTAFLTVIVGDDSLIADFSGDLIVDCNNNAVALSAENYPTTEYLWTMGDGNTYTTDSVYHQYLNPGSYIINLLLTDSNSCELMDSSSLEIEILPTIDASISLMDTFGCIPFTTNFSNATNINVDQLFWDFGDGTSSNLLNPSHDYPSVGSFLVTLIASDTNTCNLSDTAFALVNAVDDRIVADIQIDTVFFECDSLIMQFSSLNANATAHNWDFGNGILSTDSSVEVTFTDGNFDGNYRVEDSNFVCKPLDTLAFNFLVLPEIKANIALNDSFGCIPLAISFTNFTNIAVDNYAWTFGDGNVSNQENPTNTYANIGNYNVSLIASDTNTCNLSDTAFAIVNAVDDRIVADIQIDTVFFECDSLIMRFSSLNANATAYDWDFGNGILSTDSSVEVTFTDGNFDGNYRVEDSNFVCKPLDTLAFNFLVLPEIKANIALNDSFGCIPLSISFTNLTNISVDNYAWTFGDGNVSNQENPTNTYANIGNYNVSFIASDTNTCNLSDTAFALVNAVDDRIVADIQIDTVFFECDSLIMRFSSLNANATAHNWDFGNGILSTDSSVEVTFTDGNFDGNYRVQDSNFVCKPLDTLAFNFLVLPEIKANTSISDSSGCAPLGVVFNASVNYPVDSFAWYFGDGNSDEFLNGTHTYLNEGNYLATFYAIDSNTCNLADSAQYPIIVSNDIAVASITVIETSFGCDSLLVNFESDNIIGSHFWNFGDGNTASTNPVSHNYSSFGIYDVVYVLYDSTKVCNPYDTAFYQVKFEALQAVISPNDSSGCIPFSYIYHTNTVAQNYTWDFGNGNFSNTQTGTQVYNSVGNYNLSLIVEDSTTCNILDTAFANVTTENTSVIANFNHLVLSDCDALLSVQVDNQSINGADYAWFLDGVLNSNFEAPGVFNFTTLGIHTIMLVVQNDTLCNPVDTMRISLELKPNAVAQFNIEDHCENSNIMINNTSLSADAYFWTFGNGETATAEEPNFVYDQSGTYTVTLTITDSSTCNINHTISETVNIIEYASANFVTDSLTYLYPDDVYFTNLSSNYDNFLWSFGDGKTESEEENPVHSYTVLYDIKPCLSVWNAYCGDTICKDIYMDFKALIGVPNAFSPNADGINDIVYVEGIGIRALNFKIYNRWGELVFMSTDQRTGWDGKYKNIDQEMEVYTYVVEAIFINDTQSVLKGNITLLR